MNKKIDGCYMCNREGGIEDEEYCEINN